MRNIWLEAGLALYSILTRGDLSPGRLVTGKRGRQSDGKAVILIGAFVCVSFLFSKEEP